MYIQYIVPRTTATTEPLKFFGDQHRRIGTKLHTLTMSLLYLYRCPSKRTDVLDFVLTYFARKFLPIETAHSYLNCLGGHVFDTPCMEVQWLLRVDGAARSSCKFNHSHQSLRLVQPIGNLAGTGRSCTQCPGHVPRGAVHHASNTRNMRVHKPAHCCRSTGGAMARLSLVAQK